jgi:serine protease inhibitor
MDTPRSSSSRYLLSRAPRFAGVLAALALVPLACSLSLAGCASVSPQPSDPPVTYGTRALTASEQQVSDAGMRFGLNLFQQALRFESGKNMFISPLSYAQALGMSANGAVGATQDSMRSGLALADMNQMAANAAMQSLSTLLLTTDQNVEFRIANSIWHNQRFSVEQPFLNLARQYFDAEVRGMNFADPSAKDVINAWVEGKTNNRIKNLLQSPLRPDVDLMVLINAVYFNGAWTYRFDPANTKDGVFQNETGGRATTCKMMRLDKAADFGVRYEPDFTLIDIPYSNRQFSMTVVLPNTGKKLGDVMRSITPASWARLTTNISTSAMVLVMPKFGMETRYQESGLAINEQRELHGLGMGIAFDPRRADFTGMYTRASLNGEKAYIGKVIHQTFLKVDERGTEAAAATAVQIVQTTSFPSAPREIVLDRPFAFFIREKNSKAILFAGTLYEPKE